MLGHCGLMSTEAPPNKKDGRDFWHCETNFCGVLLQFMEEIGTSYSPGWQFGVKTHPKWCRISSINRINHVEGVNHSDLRFLPANGTNDPGQKEDWFVSANFIRSCDLPSHYEFPVAQSLAWFGLWRSFEGYNGKLLDFTSILNDHLEASVLSRLNLPKSLRCNDTVKQNPAASVLWYLP